MDAVLQPSDKDNQPPAMDVEHVKPLREGWDHIRALDEVENWVERNRVVSKADHVYYTSCAQEIVDELIDSLPVFHHQQQPRGRSLSPPPAVIPTEHPIDDFQYMSEFTDQDFQGSAAQFDVDYLEKMTASNSQPSALTRESLYVKFDPLVGGNSPRTAHKTPSLPTVRRITPGSNDLLMMNTPPHGASHAAASISPSNDLLTGSPSLPLPNDASAVESQDTTLSTTLLDSSPHPPPSSSFPETAELVKVLKFGDEDVKQMMEASRQEEREKLEHQLVSLREELSHRESSLQQELSHKEMGAQKRVDRLQRECESLRTELALHIAEKAKLQEEVERWKQLAETHAETEAKILEKHEELKGEIRKLEQQRDQTLTEFESLEKAFGDLHQRHLKLKTTSQTLHKNEEDLKHCISELETGNRSGEERFRQLQDEVQEKLREANRTYDSLKREHMSDMAVTKANVKKLTLQVASLERALQQKDQEKAELTQICDDLMKELGNQ